MDVFTEARNLAQRYEKGDAFRLHVRARSSLVVPVLVLFLAFSIALGLGLFGVMGTSGFGVFLAMVLVPFVLLGSFALQCFVFFSWLELRALEPILAHHAAPARGTWVSRLRTRLGKPPPAIPWIAVTLLVFIPFLLLAAASPKAAFLVLVAAAATPVAYALLD